MSTFFSILRAAEGVKAKDLWQVPLEYPYVDWKAGSIFLPSDSVEFNSAKHGTIKRAKRTGLLRAKRTGLLTAPIVVRRRTARRVSRLLYLPVLHIWLQIFLETFRECVPLTMRGPDLRENGAAVCPTYYQQPLTASVRSLLQLIPGMLQKVPTWSSS